MKHLRSSDQLWLRYSRPARFLPLLSLLFMISCSDQAEIKSDPLAISNRSLVIPDRKFLMIRLQSPALLEHATTNQTGAQVSSDEIATLNHEQEEFIQNLSEISSDIKVLFRYKFVLNGLAVVIPSAVESKVKALPGVREAQDDKFFERPEFVDSHEGSAENIQLRNSATFIGSLRIRDELKVKDPNGTEIPVDGTGIKVGIIDTGIDYTHTMLGGSGQLDDYQMAASSDDGAGFFPNRKVVGGIDLVGNDYDAGSHDYDKRIPHPGLNPLDTQGHGTHVAGTVAGYGDGVNTYTGVAPESSLYAIRVFGTEGSTSDSVVIAALEYAVDPTRSDNPENHLDVVNLSLGSRFGLPHSLYDEAIRNLIHANVTPVISAGNSGDIPYIVGSPGVSESAISVAASTDDMDQNWRFDALEFSSPGQEPTLARVVEASFTKPVKEAQNLHSELYFIGFADADLGEDVRERLKGKVALIDRGQVSFFDKIQRAWDAGAVGAVVVNNSDGEAIPMGGSGDIPIPGVMIARDLGRQIKSMLSEGKIVGVNFASDKKIEQPELIDKITDFSSRGPRSLDAAIKPEITAPGSYILSAKSGSGHEGVAHSGTSMAAPHVTGIVALLKQFRPEFSEEDVRSALTGSGKILSKSGDQYYSVARQGAGRVQGFKALTSGIVTSPATLSLGQHELTSKKVMRRRIQITNTTSEAQLLTVSAELFGGVDMQAPEQLSLAAGQSVAMDLLIQLHAPEEGTVARESFGWIHFKNQDASVHHVVPFLGVTVRQSQLEAGELRIHGNNTMDSREALAELEIQNHSQTRGEALLFNLLAKDHRKGGIGELQRFSDICDLEAVGYRVMQAEYEGEKIQLLQIAAKLYSPLTTWHHCEISVQIDGNGDGVTDQELLGTDLSTLSGVFAPGVFASVLTDAHAMRAIRMDYDQGGIGDYRAAILDVQQLRLYEHGTLAVLSVRMDRLATTGPGLMKIKVASLVASSVIRTADDFLLDHESRWETVDPYPRMSPFYDLPNVITVEGGQKKSVYFTKGERDGALIAFFPQNAVSRSVLLQDHQSQILENRFLY